MVLMLLLLYTVFLNTVVAKLCCTSEAIGEQHGDKQKAFAAMSAFRLLTLVSPQVGQVSCCMTCNMPCLVSRT